MTPNDYDDSEFIKLREKTHELEVHVARLQEQIIASKEALSLANKALDAYKSANNEWRSSLDDAREEINKYMLTATADARFDKEMGQRGALADRVYALEKNRNEQTGRVTGIDKTWAVIYAVSILLVALGTMWVLTRGK
jgi:type II secretory pathway pseudopilin PulG